MLKFKHHNVHPFTFIKNKASLIISKKNKAVFSMTIDNQARSTRNSNSLLTKFNLNFFCENSKKESDNNNNDNHIKRYNYEYEAPENLDFEYKSKLKNFVILLFSICLFSFGFYIFFLRKLNLLTKKYHFYFLTEYFELKIASFISNKIQKIFSHYIYKHESEFALQALDVYTILLNKNNFLNTTTNKIEKENIFVIESEALGCFMLKNGDLFISSRLMEVCQSNPSHLGFFIASEIAFQAMGLDSSRILKIFFDLKSINSVVRYKDKENQELPKFSLADSKKKDLELYNRFLSFYPESVVLNYLEEKEVLKIVLRILHKADFNVCEAIEIMKFFDEKMMFYPHKYKVANKNVRYRYYDILVNLVKIYKINQK